MQANVSQPSPDASSQGASAKSSLSGSASIQPGTSRRKSRRTRRAREQEPTPKSSSQPSKKRSRPSSQTSGKTSSKAKTAKANQSKNRQPKASKANPQRRSSVFARFNRKTTPKPNKPKRIDVLFQGETQVDQPTSALAQSGETLMGSKLLFDLVLVRPWILVCGFWLLLLGTSAIALSGLADPGKPDVSELNAGKVQPLQPLSVAPDTAVTSRLAESPVALDGGHTSSSANQPLPMWSLWVMVGACATGCILLSRPGLMTFGTPERRRASQTNRKLAQTGTAKQPSKPQSGKFTNSKSRRKTAKARRRSSPQSQMRRPQLKPNYPQGQVMSVSNQGAIKQVTPTRTVQPADSRHVSFEVGQNETDHQPQVSVIPANESHALDWQEGSLAHQLDVRQNRSLKSFL